MKKEIQIIHGKNLMQIQGSSKKKSGFIKIIMSDDNINDFFSGYYQDKQVIKKVTLVMEAGEIK